MNLIEGLQKEAQRRRDVLPNYEAIGAPGQIAVAIFKAEIIMAEKAIANGDVVEMVAVYKELSEADVAA